MRKKVLEACQCSTNMHMVCPPALNAVIDNTMPGLHSQALKHLFWLRALLREDAKQDGSCSRLNAELETSSACTQLYTQSGCLLWVQCLPGLSLSRYVRKLMGCVVPSCSHSSTPYLDASAHRISLLFVVVWEALCFIAGAFNPGRCMGTGCAGDGLTSFLPAAALDRSCAALIDRH